MQQQYQQKSKVQPQHSSPIHQRKKHQPFLNITKRRRLSHTTQIIKQKQTNTSAEGEQKIENIFEGVNKNIGYRQVSSEPVQQNTQYHRRSHHHKQKSAVSNSDTIQNNYIKIQMMRQQEKSKWNTHIGGRNNMLTFFPTYTTLVDHHARDLYIHRIIGQNKAQETVKAATINDGNETNDKSFGSDASQRQKLVPIKKGRKQILDSPNKSNNKGNINVSFFNIQKVCLVPINPPQNSDSRPKNSFTATLVNKRAFVIPRHSFDQSKTIQLVDNSKLQQQLTVKDSEATTFPFARTSNNFKNQINFNVTRIRPFNPPFQRYYYFDFIWKVAYSNQIKFQFIENLQKKYKVYIGPGNNSMLIKTFFKRRESWWAITDRIDEANFVWTQIKVNYLHNGQKICKTSVKHIQTNSCHQQLSKKKNGLQYKRNAKILNEKLLENWLHYYESNKQTEQKLPQNFAKRNKLLKCSNFRSISQFPANSVTQNASNTSSGIEQIEKVKIHNHLPRNYVLGNKKALFATMKKFYQSSKQQVFEYLPLTFHIQNGLQDKQYFKFLQHYYKKSKQSKQAQKSQKVRNIWIVKPGQFTNRGNGIIVCKTLEEIKSIVKNKKKLQNGNMRTYILQEYLDRPFLYQKRKFDIRHYMLITCVNGHIKGYWYQLGYIRTTSYQYSVKNSFSSVHLTNDAVQKLLPDYGKYEKGNKISYDQFQKYLDRQYKGKYSFYKTIYPQMRKIAHDSMRASALLIDQERRQHNFEIFGFDFMIDSHFHPWLIQINTNPCLQLSCPVLMDVIPDMVQNALKIGVDSILPPPFAFSQKRPRFSDNIVEQNKFELLYDSAIEEQQLVRMFSGGDDIKLNYKQLEKDQDEVYEDDGVELQD